MFQIDPLKFGEQAADVLFFYANTGISVTLFKNTYGSYGSQVQSKTQYIELAPGASTTLQFDMDNVSDGWRYYVRAYYYSAGSQVQLAYTSFHTIIFPEVPQFVRGDVNGDNQVNMDDLTALINYLVFGGSPTNPAGAAACDSINSNTINMDDLTALINYLVYNTW